MPKSKEYTVVTKIKLEDGSVLPWSNTRFRLYKKNGEYKSECIQKEFLVPLEDRLAYEKSMFKRVGEQMSLRYSRGELSQEVAL